MPSAVFDAITYALYGEHRGGKQKAEQLVRHGANGFEIEFDFEFLGTDYRIRRTRSRKKGDRPTQHLLRHGDGGWTFVRGSDPSGAVDDDDIKDCVAETMGLGFDAFTSSVLLRQGKAEEYAGVCKTFGISFAELQAQATEDREYVTLCPEFYREHARQEAAFATGRPL